MAAVSWIKIVTDIFDDEKILLIEAMPEHDAIIVIWFKLLCLAGKQNNSGVFMLNDRFPYTDEMFATIFRRPLNTVRLALSTFQNLGMIEIINDAVTIPNWGKHQNLDQLEARRSYMNGYMREYREKQKQKALESVDDTCKTNSKANSKANVSKADKIREEKIRIDKNREYIDDSAPAPSKKTVPERHKHGEYNNVLLSDAELEKLKAEFPNDWEQRIEKLSSYIASTGKSYKNHLATIRNWQRMQDEKDAKEEQNNANKAEQQYKKPIKWVD